MTRLLATLIVLLTAAAAWAQGPGPGVNPWVINGNTISYNNGGITVPSTVTGKSKGAGTINVSGGYYVNGALIKGVASATPPIVYSSETVSFDFTVANTWVGAQTFAPTGLLVGGSSSGTISLQVAAVAGTSVLKFPAGSTDFSATGGTSNVVKQVSAGAALTVGQLACADISTAGAFCAGTDAANLTGTVASARLSGSYTGITGVGTLTAGATGAGFTVALSTSTVTGTLAVARGGTGLGTFGGTNTLLYTSAADTLSSLVTANNGVLVTSAGGVPSIGGTLPSAVQTNITSLGTVTAGTLNTGVTVNAGNVTWSGQIPGANVVAAANTSGAPSATFGVVKCDGTTITCASGVITSVGGVATSVQVGVTTVTSGTTLNILYNNAGVLANQPAASFLSAGNGILITGTTTAALAVDKATAANTWAATSNKVITADIAASAGALTSLTSATTIAVDMALGINFTVTLGHNATLGAPTNPQVGRCGQIFVVQPGAGGPFTLAYNAAWKFAGGVVPVATTTANAVDVLTYCTRTSSNLPATLITDVK